MEKQESSYFCWKAMFKLFEHCFSAEILSLKFSLNLCGLQLARKQVENSANTARMKKVLNRHNVVAPLFWLLGSRKEEEIMNNLKYYWNRINRHWKYKCFLVYQCFYLWTKKPQHCFKSRNEQQKWNKTKNDPHSWYWYCEVTGSNSVEVLKCFQTYLHNCINCIQNSSFWKLSSFQKLFILNSNTQNLPCFLSNEQNPTSLISLPFSSLMTTSRRSESTSIPTLESMSLMSDADGFWFPPRVARR